ncbi:hypothetical protein, partial [Escherichia coli]|uniref:hypothetical protein n=1 Tax=Escherichia coli TaxID=562 RepID=UPI001F474AC4
MPLQPTARTKALFLALSVILPSTYYHIYQIQESEYSNIPIHTYLCREVSKIHYNMNHSKTTGCSHTVVGRRRRHT